MGYRRVNLPVNFIGVSTDQLPVATATETIAEGSTATESDTGVKWQYHLGQWVRAQDEEVQAVTDSADLAADQLAALLRIERLLELQVAGGQEA